MKVRNVLFSQILRYFTVTGPAGGAIYGLNLVRGFQSRYGFLEGPKAVADYNLETGITFQHGYFEDRVVIDKCMIFRNGLVIESKAPVEEWEHIVDDIAAWADGAAGIKMVPWEGAARGYYSHLEVICEASLGRAIDRFGDFISILGDTLQSYGQPRIVFEPSQISFHTDVTNMPYPKPAQFTFERRAEQPYSSNIYFSAAPLRTGDHLRLLNVFEEILS